MISVKLYLYDKLKRQGGFKISWDNSKVFKELTIDKCEDLWDLPLMINNNFYSVCVSEGNNYAIKKLDFYRFDEDIDDVYNYGEDEIKCPVCGYEISDS